MFYCNHCKSVFDEPKEELESRGEFWGAPAYESMYYCPCCGDDDYDEIIGVDCYEDPIFKNDYYYEFDGDRVTEDNLEYYLEEMGYKKFAL